MWCVPELNRQYVERMEDVLNLMEKPATVKEPVVAFDERPVQLHATERMGRPMDPGRVAQRDYEYVRRGTANIFCIVAPKTGRHLTHATTNRTARRFASAMKRISDAYPDAKRRRALGSPSHAARSPCHPRTGPLERHAVPCSRAGQFVPYRPRLGLGEPHGIVDAAMEQYPMRRIRAILRLKHELKLSNRQISGSRSVPPVADGEDGAAVNPRRWRTANASSVSDAPTVGFSATAFPFWRPSSGCVGTDPRSGLASSPSRPASAAKWVPGS